MIEQVRSLARQLTEADPNTDPRITVAPSGALMLDVNVRGRRYVLEYLPSLQGFGVSPVDTATFGWEGGEASFDDFDGAKTYLLGLVAIEIDGERYLLMTPQLAGIACSELGPAIGSVADQRSAIVSALDLLITGA